MNKVSIMFTIVICLILAACASQPNVFTDLDPEQDFSQYSTFSWASESPMTVQSDYIISPLVEKRLMDAIKATMTQKGYTFVDEIGAGDMGISFTVGARDKMRTRQEPAITAGFGWRWGGQYWGINGPITTETTQVYSEGTLAIDVLDTARGAPVWHGVSSKRLSKVEDAVTPELVNSAVSVTLESFPAK